MTVHLAVTSGIPLPVCGETLRGSFTSLHRFSKMAHPVLGARVFARTLDFRTYFQGHLAAVNTGFDDPRRRYASIRGMTRDDRSQRRPVGPAQVTSSTAEKCGAAEEPLSRMCLFAIPINSVHRELRNRMINRHWTTLELVAENCDRISDRYDYSLPFDRLRSSSLRITTDSRCVHVAPI